MSKNKKYYKTLKEQANDQFREMIHFGESKKEYKLSKTNTLDSKGNETDRRLYSYGSLSTYKKYVMVFIKYIEEHHSEETSLKKCRKYVKEYLDYLIKTGKAASTVHTASKALNKLYGITVESKDYYKCPRRNRVDIKRSRKPVKSDRHFSTTNNADLIGFATGTGLRARELGRLKKEDIYDRVKLEKKLAEVLSGKEDIRKRNRMIEAIKETMLFDEDYYVYTKYGKGGRIRFSPVLKEYQDLVLEKFKMAKPGERVWKNIHSHADIQSYRREYANLIYERYERDLSELPRKIPDYSGKRKFKRSLYYCRNDLRGVALDRQALYKCTKALGHNRIRVAPSNYIDKTKDKNG